MDKAVQQTADEIDRIAADYLRHAGSNAYRALRLAISDLIQVSVDSRIVQAELRRATSAGYLRRPPLDRASQQSPPRDRSAAGSEAGAHRNETAQAR